MAKSKVRIRFPDVHALWEFARNIQFNAIEIDTHERVLTCYCTRAQLSLAEEAYGAEELQNEFRPLHMN